MALDPDHCACVLDDSSYSAATPDRNQKESNK